MDMGLRSKFENLLGNKILGSARGALMQSEIPKIPKLYLDILKYRQQIPNRLEKIPTGIQKN